MATRFDCACEQVQDPQSAQDGLLRPPTLIYNPYCPFHRGPDKGYGYDLRGLPNSRYSEKAGTIITIAIVALCVAGIIGVGLAMFQW